MRWSEVDLEARLWTIPANRAKNGQAHLVPLSDLAVTVLATTPRISGKPDWVFTTGTARRGESGEQTQKLVPVSGFSRAKLRLDRALAPELPQPGEPEVDEMPPWRLHDLRRSAATGMARLGVSQAVVERVLNHVGSSGGLVAVYQRHSYADEKRAALGSWAAHLEKLVVGRCCTKTA
jgi:integrase